MMREPSFGLVKETSVARSPGRYPNAVFGEMQIWLALARTPVDGLLGECTGEERIADAGLSPY